MKLRILSSALEDLTEGYSFYENQKRGLGKYFFETLFSEIDKLENIAGIHPEIYGHYRLLSKKFPYAIYYKIDSNEVLINAILDCRRDPEWIKKKLK